MIRFCSLGSGSTGNGTLVEAHGGRTVTRVLIDCGFSAKELSLRLGRIGLAPDDLDAVFITHEHADHVGCVATLVRRHGIALWTSRGTWAGFSQPDLADKLHFARDGDRIAIGDLELRPYTVPHDAREPLQLRFSDGAHDLGVLTDAGSVTAHLVNHLRGCHALLLECNHDREMLERSRYPWPLKSRIAGRLGHLSNDTASEILATVRHNRLNTVVAGHLSLENNRPALAATALARAGNCATSDIRVAGADWGFDWIEVH